MKLKSLAVSLLLALSGTVFAQSVQVDGGWVRATVPGQKATAAFMKLTTQGDTQLVGASSPVAGVTEVHEMAMDGQVMRMRAVPALRLLAGQAVELKPGGYHVMLMDLKGALAAGSTVPLTLNFKDAQGQASRVELQLPVQGGIVHQGGHDPKKH